MLERWKSLTQTPTHSHSHAHVPITIVWKCCIYFNSLRNNESKNKTEYFATSPDHLPEVQLLYCAESFHQSQGLFLCPFLSLFDLLTLQWYYLYSIYRQSFFQDQSMKVKVNQYDGKITTMLCSDWE